MPATAYTDAELAVELIKRDLNMNKTRKATACSYDRMQKIIVRIKEGEFDELKSRVLNEVVPQSLEEHMECAAANMCKQLASFKINRHEGPTAKDLAISLAIITRELAIWRKNLPALPTTNDTNRIDLSRLTRDELKVFMKAFDVVTNTTGPIEVSDLDNPVVYNPNDHSTTPSQPSDTTTAG